MAEQRRDSHLCYGHTGSLIYIPSNEAFNGPGHLHTTRLLSSSPRFRVVGSSAELYPATRSPPTPWASRLSDARKAQKRWLVQSHPQAAIGNTVMQEILFDEMEHFKHIDPSSVDGSVLAMGQLSDIRDRRQIRETQALAAAAGESGEILRLTRVTDATWQWGDRTDGTMKLSIIDSVCREEELLWQSDSLPITHIKFATHVSSFGFTRWLLVQKSTSTTILQPEYSSRPIPNGQKNDSISNQEPSFINANPLLALSHHETGGNAHADVAFNPPLVGRPAQLAVIDECGFWSVWNILGMWHISRKTIRFSLYRCGHISEGPMDEIPRSSTYPAERHGIMRISLPKDHSGFFSSSQEAEPAEAISQLFLIWNSIRLKVFDLDTTTLLPDICGLWPDGSSDTQSSILDVQQSPIHSGHIIILTTEQVVLVDLFHEGKASAPSQFQPTVLLSCAHQNPGNMETKMSICDASNETYESVLALIYSPFSSTAAALWLNRSRKEGLLQVHRCATSLPDISGKTTTPNAQLITIEPAVFSTSSNVSIPGPATTYKELGLQFFQMRILGRDLSVRYCVCSIDKAPTLNVILPTNRIDRTLTDQRKQFRKIRKRFLRHLEDTFVIPDKMTDEELFTLIRQNDSTKQIEESSVAPASAIGVGAKVLEFDMLSSAVRELMRDSLRDGESGVSVSFLKSIYDILGRGVNNGWLGLMTWRDVATELDESYKYDTVESADAVMTDLLQQADGKVVITDLKTYSSTMSPQPLIAFSDLQRAFSDFWFHSLPGVISGTVERNNQIWISRISLEVLLSNHGIAVQDVPIFGDDLDIAHTRDNDDHQVSSQLKRRLSSSSPGVPSSSAPSNDKVQRDAAMERLKLLVPRMEPSHLAATKPNSILSFWPTERGVETQDYVSSVDIAYNEKFRDARERLQKTLSKRKKQAEKYKKPAFMRQGFPTSDGLGDANSSPAQPMRPPPVQIMSSQQGPSSSQTQMPSGPSFTMSQPVEGAFGTRKKSKKPKRKSGFR